MTLNLQPQSAASNDGPTEMSPSPMPQNVWPPPQWVTYLQQFQQNPSWSQTRRRRRRSRELCLYGHALFV